MKSIFLIFIGAMLCFSVYGATPGVEYGMAGCGLGSIVMGSGGQISAGTTNSTAYNQWFGITSGTSNCVPESQAQAALLEQYRFMQGNYTTLAKEISQGSGETLAAYSDVLGCEGEMFPQFAAQLQNSYTKLFAKPGIAATLDATKDELRGNPELSSACQNI